MNVFRKLWEAIFPTTKQVVIDVTPKPEARDPNPVFSENWKPIPPDTPKQPVVEKPEPIKPVKKTAKKTTKNKKQK